MNDFESRLADLLHTGAPEPRRVITASEIAGLPHEARKPSPRRAQRWGVPLLAAAAVAVAVAVPVIFSGKDTNPIAPTSPTDSVPHPPPTRTTTPTPSTTSSPGGACATSQLSLSAGPTDGAAGSIYTTFYLTNTAASPCSIRGFPGVSLLDTAGGIVGQPATREGSEGPSVRLGPDQRASFILRVGTATRTGCNVPIPSTQVKVYPPDQSGPLQIPFATGSCAVSVQSVRGP